MTPGQPPSIEVEALVKRYKQADRNAVDGVSFSVGAGEFFALLGPNGAGKTTTISILTTTLLPTAGAVRVAGFDVRSQASQVRRSVGIIFQRPSLDLNLSAEENIRFHAVLYGIAPFRPSFALMPEWYKQKVSELADVLGLTGELGKPVKTFSGGMKRKLEIVRSLIHSPKVLFLDEPTVGLDPLSRRALWEYLRSVRSEHGTTVFLTTHYLDEAEGADRICIINHGQVVSYGTPEAVKSKLIEDYLLLDSPDRAALRRELAERCIPFQEAARFKVPLNGRTAQEVIHAIQTPLTHLQVHTPTLEDAYLAIISDEVLADAL